MKRHFLLLATSLIFSALQAQIIPHFTIIGLDQLRGLPPTEFLPISPNPANESVLFSWKQCSPQQVTLRVADILGSIAITIPLGEKIVGLHDKPFSTAALSPGTYVASLQIGPDIFTQQFVVLH